MPKATITSKGQVTIPKRVRDRLGLKPGDKLDFTVQPNGTLRVRPLGPDGEERPLAGFLEDRVRVKQPITVEEMEESMAEYVATHVLSSLDDAEDSSDAA